MHESGDSVIGLLQRFIRQPSSPQRTTKKHVVRCLRFIVSRRVPFLPESPFRRIIISSLPNSKALVQRWMLQSATYFLPLWMRQMQENLLIQEFFFQFHGSDCIMIHLSLMKLSIQASSYSLMQYNSLHNLGNLSKPFKRLNTVFQALCSGRLVLAAQIM